MPSPAADQALSAGGDPFLTGRVAMKPIGVWGWWVFKGAEEQFPFGCAALPKGAPNAKAVIFTDPWVLSKSSKHPQEAWEFLKYLSSADVQRGWMQLTGAPPVRKSLAEEWYKQFPSMKPEEVKEVHLGALKHGRESPNHLLVKFDQLNQVVSSAVDPIVNNEKKAADALPEANKKLVDALKQIQAEYKK
jgi:multiple sugar transport system substrate-binding protein